MNTLGGNTLELLRQVRNFVLFRIHDCVVQRSLTKNINFVLYCFCKSFTTMWPPIANGFKNHTTITKSKSKSKPIPPQSHLHHHHKLIRIRTHRGTTIPQQPTTIFPYRYTQPQQNPLSHHTHHQPNWLSAKKKKKTIELNWERENFILLSKERSFSCRIVLRPKTRESEDQRESFVTM